MSKSRRKYQVTQKSVDPGIIFQNKLKLRDRKSKGLKAQYVETLLIWGKTCPYCPTNLLNRWDQVNFVWVQLAIRSILIFFLVKFCKILPNTAVLLQFWSNKCYGLRRFCRWSIFSTIGSLITLIITSSISSSPSCSLLKSIP